MQEGLTPLDVAKKKRRLDVIEFLEENGIYVISTLYTSTVMNNTL